MESTEAQITRKAHNVDRERTEQAHFLDPRSYWTNAGHEYLFGDDARQRRAEIFERDKGQCQIRKSRKCWSEPGWYGHLHHLKGGNTDDRCWCPHNLQWACGPCHLEEHVRIKFGSAADVKLIGGER